MDHVEDCALVQIELATDFADPQRLFGTGEKLEDSEAFVEGRDPLEFGFYSGMHGRLFSIESGISL
jgi:hypothetical protein